MTEIGVVALVIVILNLVVSYKGFKDTAFYDKYAFIVNEMLVHKEYYRLISSGFLHVDWMHLLFNMMSLCFFSADVEAVLGIKNFIIIYMSSLVGGNLLSLFIHRHHGDYSAVGASGAVCGIIFACIALFPNMEIGFFGIPLYIPAWIYGVLYMLFTIFRIKDKNDNVGHEAHLGGAFIGLVFAVCIEPQAVKQHYLPILAILLPCLLFMYLLVRKPHIVLTGNTPGPQRFLNVEDRYNQQKAIQQQEIDAILEKIHRQGINSLSAEEKQKLQNYAER
ncbi:rhomboid family intramembrane serine protease [Chitinophaga sp. G-6-1-13]|uniref:Rhomboid family intramembrane serine protease n=1 Tax=Chitinophaga fulva TaxID=2728842 RepID=A0A848GLS5_9BACT|nr:rhomboid family intramembrane serine protease [Chitinophaga fulva]NML36908.1 rhomboid family intramembrane serine protease [Chitinophaga fulva]